MNHRMDWMLLKTMGFALCATMFVSVPVVADEANAVRAVKLDPDKLAGINLPAEEQFIAPEDVLEGNHRPRGEVLHYGEQLIVEVFEDDQLFFSRQVYAGELVGRKKPLRVKRQGENHFAGNNQCGDS